MAHTTPQDVKGRWLLDEDPPGDTKITVVISDAEDTILSAIPDLEDRITDGRIPVERLRKIVSRMVIRHVRNPEGIRQEQETTGPFNASKTYGGDEPGSVYLTEAERRELLGRRVGKAFMVDTMPPQPLEAW